MSPCSLAASPQFGQVLSSLHQAGVVFFYFEHILSAAGRSTRVGWSRAHSAVLPLARWDYSAFGCQEVEIRRLGTGAGIKHSQSAQTSAGYSGARAREGAQGESPGNHSFCLPCWVNHSPLFLSCGPQGLRTLGRPQGPLRPGLCLCKGKEPDVAEMSEAMKERGRSPSSWNPAQVTLVSPSTLPARGRCKLG